MTGRPDFKVSGSELDPSLEQLLDDLIERLQAGEEVDLEAVIREHPDYAEPIRRMMPAMEALVDFGETSVLGNGHRPGPVGEAGVPEKVLGDFRLLREIGRGGMGIVYEAEQVSLGRRVALKLLPMAAALDPRQIQRFRVEAQAAACLHHPHIVPVHGVGCERGVHYYAMQLIDGRSLAAMIAELRRLDGLDPPDAAAPDLAAITTTTLASRLLSGGATVQPGAAGSDSPTAALTAPLLPSPLPGEGGPQGRMRGLPDGQKPPTKSPSSTSTRNRDYVQSAARLALQAAEALDHAHARGILHRDIKPGNLLLDAEGRLWVTDFGLAQVRGDDRVTLTGDVLGTLRYMSPEQALGRRTVIDGRTDVYSLGVTLYELLTLRPAVDGRDRAEILRRIADAEPKPLRKLNPAVPADLETIVLKATAKDPAARYATAQELAEDLRSFLEHRPIQARRPGLLDRAAKWSRRHRPVVATAALLLVLGTAVSTWQAIRAMRAEARTRDERDRAIKAEGRASESARRAQTEASIAQAVNDFLLNDLLAEAAPDRNPRGRQISVEAVLNKAAARIAGKFDGQPEIEAQIRWTVAETYRALGLDSEGFPHMERALELFHEALGPEHPRTLSTMNCLAVFYRRRGQSEEAEPLYRKALEGQRRVLGEDDPATLTTMENLAVLCESRGRLDEAARLHSHVLEAQRRVLGPEHPDTLLTTYNVAMFHRGGRLAESLALLKQAVDGLGRKLGTEHPRTLIAMSGLAQTYDQLKKYDQAEPLFKQTIDTCRGVLGPEHPETLITMHNLAVMYRHRGDARKAESLERQVLEAEIRVLGPEHPETLKAMNQLAVALVNLGRYDEAETLYRRVLEARRLKFGLENPGTLTTMHNLARCLMELGRDREAEPLCRDALNARSHVLGPSHPNTISTMFRLVQLYQKLGKPTDAEPLVIRLVGALRGKPDDEESDLPFALYLQGHNLLLLRRFDEAEAVVREALTIYKKSSPDDRLRFDCESLLGESLVGQKKYAEAEPLLLSGYKGLKSREHAIPDRFKAHFDQSIERIVRLYESWGKPKKAAEWRVRRRPADLPASVFAGP